MKKNEEQKKTERYVLLIYMIYCIIFTVVVIRGRWPSWLAVVLDMSFLASFALHAVKYRDYHFRAYFVTSLMQINVVLWSITAADLPMTVPVLVALTVVLGLYGIPEIIYITIASATFLDFYHLLVIDVINSASIDGKIQTILEILAVYFVAVMMYLMNRRQLENDERQQEVIESLKEAERSKDDFLANVSHEIRTPINTICGMSEIVLREPLQDTVRADVFSIQAAGRNLLSVVSDVLDFSELQSGKMALAEEAYNITSTINDVINMTMARKSEKEIELIVDCSADIPSSLYGDEQKIRRVIMNLVNNALKFTTEGCVSISISSRNTDYGINLIVRVKDTGIGLKEESMEKIFTSFNQVDARRNRQEGGIGLGLAISQAMVDEMGGFITVSSEYGKGSEIQFVVPQKVLDRRPIVVVRDPEHLNVAVYINMEQFDRVEIRDEYSRVIHHMISQLKIKSHYCQTLAELKRRVEREIYTHIFISIVEYEESREFFDKMSKITKVILIIDQLEDAKVANSAIFKLYKPCFILPVVMILNEEKIIQGMDEDFYYHGKFIAPDSSVLVVDDNLMNIRVLEGLLRPYKIKVSMATSGAEALEKIDSMSYDFIFMDHMMPEMDGIETLHRIRQKQGNYFKKIPVVALTANAIGGMREVFLEEGFQDFMAKPIELSVLERVLRRNLPQEKQIPIRQEEAQGMEEAGTSEQTVNTDGRQTDLPADSFNEQAGIRYCGGIKNYIDVLKITSRNGQENRTKIQECFDKKDWKNYTIYVHALKSSMTNIGAAKLAGMAKESEFAGKRGDTEFILAHHDALMLEYEQILAIMKKSKTIYPDIPHKNTADAEDAKQKETAHSDKYAALGQAEKVQPKQPADRKTAGITQAEDTAVPKPIEEAQLDRYALEFENAAFAFDEQEMTEIAKRLSGCSYHGHSLEETMQTVLHKIRMSDYMSASDMIARLKNETE